MIMQMDRIIFYILIRYLKKAFLRLNREFTDTIESVVLYKNNNKDQE
ncbi:hypothetical protein HPNQ4044_0605 [Helicobacter pylori NQ4044]|uniref:Uncharacterized protein n=1 Tax=Helicobacter pylori NQ4044 TaxID=992028 RepID=I9QYU8_HELPX|nr:hypothetical protein HPNQ4044_0605 [Helicobacter pylori NQ4044]